MTYCRVRLFCADEEQRHLLVHALHDVGLEVVASEGGEDPLPAIVEEPLLSPAEAEVLQALADYGSVPAICEHRQVSQATVRTQWRLLRRKLGVRTAPQLVAVGLRLGLIR